jgi:small subunit ribosomal protein S18
MQQGARRRFDHKLVCQRKYSFHILYRSYESQFIRPHYFSHDHRFKGPPPFAKRPLIGPGQKKAKQQDVFYHLGIDPLQEASNDVLMSSFVTEMGKIKHRAETGLTTKSQRRLGKAIRRAKMMGVIPVLSSSRLPWNRH